MATQFLSFKRAGSAAPANAADGRYLFGPVTDFLCLGGSSLIILPLLMLVPVAGYQMQLAAAMLFVAHFINHPHFAHSYQIFYRGFSTKAFAPTQGRGMQVRYLISGVGVPVLLVAFFVFCLATNNARLLGQGGNVMALAVGWHYVKQGYGMLMVDAALKRRFFKDHEKKILLVNCYMVWIAAWVSFNDQASTQELWGLTYYAFNLPPIAVAATGAAAVVTSGIAAWTLLQRWRASGSLPLNGVIAYTLSLYVWLLFIRINPLWGLVVPALHSLQYLIVVWRFQTNHERDRLCAPDYKAGSLARRLFGSQVLGHLSLFTLFGILVGYLGFWGLPVVLTAYVPYDRAVFGGALFLFVGWIFINVHHYFLDTVMWRRENPDTTRYLFA